MPARRSSVVAKLHHTRSHRYERYATEKSRRWFMRTKTPSPEPSTMYLKRKALSVLSQKVTMPISLKGNELAGRPDARQEKMRDSSTMFIKINGLARIPENKRKSYPAEINEVVGFQGARRGAKKREEFGANSL